MLARPLGSWGLALKSKVTPLDEWAKAELRKRTASVPLRDRFPPQEGPQEMARESDADIVIMGGAAYGGKSWALQTDPLDGVTVPGFECVHFRRLTTALTMAGGLAPESFKIYPKAGGIPKDRGKRWEFPTEADKVSGISGAVITMAHMQYQSDARKWELGGQIARAGFDQLEEFEEMMFWIIAGRMRSSTGVKPKIFATVNPVPATDPVGGWVNSLLAWWWDPETGYAIPERSGVERWFYKVNDRLHWYSSKGEAIEAHPDLHHEQTAKGEDRYNDPQSLCFIAAGIDDNPIGETINPGYRAKLNAQSEVKRQRMKFGNWKVGDSVNALFKLEYFRERFIDPQDVPEISSTVRFHDMAATRRQDADPRHSKTSSCKMGVHAPGGGQPKQFYVFDGTGAYMEMVERNRTIVATGKRDGRGVLQRVEQEGGGGGKDQVRTIVGLLAQAGLSAASVPTKGLDKLARCTPAASDCAAGNVWIVNGWDSKPFLDALALFDGQQPGSDEADCVGGAYNELNLKGGEWGSSTHD